MSIFMKSLFKPPSDFSRRRDRAWFLFGKALMDGCTKATHLYMREIPKGICQEHLGESLRLNGDIMGI